MAASDTSPPPCQPLTQTQLNVRNFPPPASLFTNTPEAGPSNTQGHMSQSQISRNPQPQMNQQRSSPTQTTSNSQQQTTSNSQQQPTPNHQPQMNQRSSNASPGQLRFSPSQSNQGSEAQHSNEFEDNGAQGIDDNDRIEPNLPERQLRFLERQLLKPNREQFTTVLSPLIPQPPNTTWFGRDKSALVRKISKICCSKFDDAYYSWSLVPRDRAELMFMEFAKTHTWDPLITGTVQAHFEEICLRRLKDMVSKAHGSGVRPSWIEETIWKKMCAYWDTEEGVQRTQTTSQARNSDRGGLGPFKTKNGQKSFLQIHQEMEEELGRAVIVGELFLATHTKPDGTYVDLKAQKIAETYEKNLQAKMAGQQEISMTSFSASVLDERGRPYGTGSLAESHKCKFSASSASYNSFEQQLEEAKRQIEAQSSHNLRLERRLETDQAERVRFHELFQTEKDQRVRLEERLDIQQSKQQIFTRVEEYLRKTDPAFLDFCTSESGPSTSS